MKRRWTDEQLVDVVECSTTYAEVLRKLGLASTGSNKNIKKHIERLGIQTGFTKSHWTDEQLILAVKESYSYAQVLEKLNLRRAGGNYGILKRNIRRLNLTIDHFTGKGSNKGKKFDNRSKPIHDLLIEGQWTNTFRLKKRLIQSGIKNHICDRCNLTEWLGAPIPLELDHINGINDDNRLENLRLLCPNCHALTPTYRGKNKK